MQPEWGNVLRSMPEPSDEVFILGAGFSKAISDAMPLTDDLGNEALQRDHERLGRSDRKLTFAGGQFESWLSRRAEPQPYLSASADMQNRAIFARTTELIAQILDERVERALVNSMPIWLGELISIWHLRRSNVLTFNYDTLIECAFETMPLWDWRAQTRFLWPSLISYSPEGKAGTSYDEIGGEVPPHDSFRLWKLHGSLNWHWVPGDSAGATVRRARLPGLFGQPDIVRADELHWSAPGRERFIVPPAALKSGYYSNPVTREIWQRGFAALQSAKKITLMGYSVPMTDLSTSGMLAEAMAAGAVTEVEVVDYAPHSGGAGSSIVERVSSLGPFNVNAHADFSGGDAISDYVARLVGEVAHTAVEALRDDESVASSPIYIDWGENNSTSFSSFELRRSDNALVLTGEHMGTTAQTTRSREEGNLPLNLADVRGALRTASRIVARFPSMQREVSVVGHVRRTYETGHGDGNWVQLIPAGACRD
jgi:hypothetical protein